MSGCIGFGVNECFNPVPEGRHFHGYYCEICRERMANR